MPKYVVEVDEIVTYTVEVEADDESEAGDIAEELVCQSENPDRDFGGRLTMRNVVTVDKIEDLDAPAQCVGCGKTVTNADLFEGLCTYCEEN